MGWHLSKSDPRKVYDERHTEICIACTGEAAALIVAAVNSLSLRIQARRKESAEQNQSIAGASEHAARAEAPALSKPDLAALQSEALGVSSADCSFAVTGRR